MVEVTNTNILDDSQKTDVEEMCRFVGIMFAMSICSMSNIKECWNVEDDGLMVAELQEGKEEVAKRKFVNQGEKPTTACVLRLMEQLAGSGVILHGDSWFASINTLEKLKELGIFFVGLIKTAHSGIPVKLLWGWFSAASARGDTKTVHLGDGLNRVYAHAWNEPGWKAG